MSVEPTDGDGFDRHQNMPTRRHLTRVLDRGPVGFVITGKSGEIHWINRTLLDWLGYEPNELIGRRTFQQLLPAGGRIYYDTHVRPLMQMQGGASEIALELVCRDERRLSVLINASLQTDADTGDPIVETFVVDATRRRQYETELLRERQLAERSEARLQVMYDIVSGLADAETVGDIVDVVTTQAAMSMSGAKCAIWLLDPVDRVAMRVGHVAGEAANPTVALEFPDGGRGLDELASGQMVVIEDRCAPDVAYPLIRDWMGGAGVRSAAIAPLMSEGRLCGAISYGYEGVHSFDDAELKAAIALAGQAEQGLARARVLEAERRNEQHLAHLLEFTMVLSAALALDDVLDALVDIGQRLLGAAGMRVALLDDTGTTVQFVRSGGAGGQVGIQLPLDRRSIACEAIRTNRPVVVTSRQGLEERFPESPILDHPRFGRAMAMPLRRGDQVLGAWVLVDHESDGPAGIDVTLFELFAEQAGQATQRAAMHAAEALARAQADTRNRVSAALNRAVTTADVGRSITIQGRAAFDASTLAFFVLDPDDPTSLRLEAQSGLDSTSIATQTSIRIDEDLARLLHGSGTPAYVVGTSDFADVLDSVLGNRHRGAAAILPLGVADHPLGLVVLGFERPDALTQVTRVALSGLAGEASIALVRARRYDVDHDVATTLQRSLRSSPDPLGEEWALTASYTPWSELLEVGGDLFDVTAFDDGRIVLVVGDVVGHGLEAAAAMGLLRSAAKMITLVATSPADVIRGLHAFARVTPAVLYSSVCCVEVGADGAGLYACAGHPYPVLRHRTGHTEVLTDGRSALLGIGDAPPSNASFVLPVGSSIVIYTDGLIERRGVTTDVGVERLRRHLEAASDAIGEVCADEIARSMLGDHDPDDDVVAVCLTRLVDVGTRTAS